MTAAALAVIQAGALRHNLETVRRMAPGCPVLAVVKANAYGHGLVATAKILSSADAFAVARLDEGLQLRDAGIAHRVVVLGGFVGEEEATVAAAGGLDVVVHSVSQVEVLEKLGQRGPANLWLKVDTGMGRLGVLPQELPGIRHRLAGLTAGRGSLQLMTHLACADDRGSPATSGQLGVFGSLLDGWRGDVSIANSAGIIAWPEAQASPAVGRNWVRPGLMLYGVSPMHGATAADLGLRPAMVFETRLIAVRHLRRGARVGYGGDWVAERDSVIGVAAAGYADGYPWHLSRGTPVMVNGAMARIVGRVSMDMISIDLTDQVAQPGDRVVLWGDDLPVETVAACAGTIPYELIAAISPRVVRQVGD